MCLETSIAILQNNMSAESDNIWTWILYFLGFFFSYFQSFIFTVFYIDFPGGSDSKASAYNVGDPRTISRLERSPGEGNGNPLQYSCLENPMDGGTW